MQPARWSFIEVTASTTFGFLVAMFTNAVVFPAFGYALPLITNIYITIVYTIVSILRSYIFRRVFNRISG
jgi:uncharacterized membrane protein YagU involved in acid resistance